MASIQESPGDFLQIILEHKNVEVAAAANRLPEVRLRERAEARKDFRPFSKRLEKPGSLGANIIAEIKRASPSKGPIRPDLDPIVQAEMYENGGAAAISVLTDQRFFSGSLEDLKRVRAKVQLPVLRKDFIVEPYQIFEAVAAGADAVLLIVRAVSFEFLTDALSLTRELGVDALVEVHSESELATATQAGAQLIGINSRDLTTFRTDLETIIRLRSLFQDDQIAVGESGIKDRSDIVRLMKAGVSNFLIGESLVRAADPGQYLAGLLGAR